MTFRKIPTGRFASSPSPSNLWETTLWKRLKNTLTRSGKNNREAVPLRPQAGGKAKTAHRHRTAPRTPKPPAPERELSLYLHVPFCASKCPYCDFYSDTAERLGLSPEEYFDLLAKEIELLLAEEPHLAERPMATLYIGGGTPSLVAPRLYRRIFEQIATAFPPLAATEWTLEINPGAVALENLGDYIALGVNRLSIGVQSFSDGVLERLGRIHRAADARALIEAIRAMAPAAPAWAADLIFGVPGQTLDQWRSDLAELIALRPHHCSIYGLTIHERTPFGRLHREGRLELPGEETQRAMFLEAHRLLTAAGYIHYEISNYALEGFRSVHNERYWTGADYVGLGVAAHSHVGGRRWANPPDIASYRAALRAGRLAREIETPPTGRALLGERIMLGLRRLEGIDLDEFRERFGTDLLKFYAPEIERLVEGGLVEIAESHLRLSEEGMLVADAVMAEFF